MFSWLRAGAMPIAAGPVTAPTIAHIILGIHTRTTCSDLRSMDDIVRSCLFTIIACVYRAIHPNIPDPNLSFWGRVNITIKITACALIAPELIIWWALRQRFGAKEVAETVNAVIERKGKMKPGVNWTQIHGQFAQMGGFARKDNNHVLYPEDIIAMLENGTIKVKDVQFTEKEINDKSKGDFLSKAVVAFQTTWFMFECVVRRHQGLPLIELEVVTLAFATLNAITYALWWYKPLNVLCPIHIRIRSHVHENVNPESDGVELTAQVGIVEGIIASIRDQVNSVGDDVKNDASKSGWLWASIKWFFIGLYWSILWPILGVVTILWTPIGVLWGVFRLLSGLIQLLWGVMWGKDGQLYDKQVTHVPTFYVAHLSDKNSSLSAGLSICVGLIFGGIHFLSWHSPFPSHAQLVLWRASCVVLIVQPFLLLLLSAFITLEARAPPGSRRGKVGQVFEVLMILFFACGTLPYVLARFCVIFLAFFTLRHLPADAFTNVTWTSYIPHF